MSQTQSIKAMRNIIRELYKDDHRPWCITIEEEFTSIYDRVYQVAKEDDPEAYREMFQKKAKTQASCLSTF